NSTVSPSSSLNHAHHFLSLKLTTKNYLLWKTQLVPFLCVQKLLGFVDGSNRCPPLTVSVHGHTDNQPNPATIAWQEQDQLLLSLLVSSLSESIIPIVVGLNTSHEVWTVLESAFVSPSNTRVLHLHMQMQRSQENDESVSTFLQLLKSHANVLSAAGRPVSPADFNIYVFKGLKSEFKDLVITLSARSNLVTHLELLGLLLSHELVHNTTLDSLSLSPPTSSTTNTSPNANLSQRKPSSPNPSHQNSFNNHGHGRSIVGAVVTGIVTIVLLLVDGR
ncbi:UBN2_3 domain-containing protein, partial [Cephalotus follicularis]